MSDSGRTLGDCRHGQSPEWCVHCLRDRVEELVREGNELSMRNDVADIVTAQNTQRDEELKKLRQSCLELKTERDGLRDKLDLVSRFMDGIRDAARNRNPEGATVLDFLSVWNEQYEKQIATLRAAVAEHHDQHADDLCWEDDDKLYAAFGLPPRDRRVGDKEAMLRNCERFIANRCEGGGPWKSYAELEKERGDLSLEVAEKNAMISGYIPHTEDGVPVPLCDRLYCPRCGAEVPEPIKHNADGRKAWHWCPTPNGDHYTIWYPVQCVSRPKPT